MKTLFNMARVHFFQRYSNKENVVTNNTLLLLSHVYDNSPELLENLITELGEDSGFQVGPVFGQQVREPKSVPDGEITQQSFKIVVETKLGQTTNPGQLKSHLEAFNNKDYQILLILNKGKVKPKIRKKVEKIITSYNTNSSSSVTGIWLRFQDLISAIKSVLGDQHIQLQDLLDDYEEYCVESGLIPRTEYRMRAVPCGKSFTQNMEYGIYYEPPGRSATPYTYLGIYTQKAIHGIGKVKNRVQVNFKNNKLSVINNEKKIPLNESERLRIKGIIEETVEERGWDISTGHEFVILDEIYETHFKKDSSGGMRGTRYFDLGEILDTEELPPVNEIADLLNNFEW
ncbi:hypothetical protein ACG2F4_05090 [Halalkalibaculum sp. DA3122]|uniref:hypothetical protein n=1 Tax=Halalkalibaculum sp. DA3122 TaxID=3373607 RepID=UPI0037548063